MAAVVIVLTAGCAAAAYQGELPAPMQRVAHTVFDAPSAARGTPRPHLVRSATPPVPGNAGYGLCRAYERAVANGHPGHNTVTFSRLAAMAGGAGQVAAYCAGLAHPGNPANGHPTHSPHANPATPAAATPAPHGKHSRAANSHGKHLGN